MKTAFLVGRVENDRDTLDELAELARTYGLEVVGTAPVRLKKLDPGTYIGSGKIEELKATTADVIIFDDEISPNQQRNLEKLFDRPVMDRTELILEVFAQRAQTNEARLQIELAQSRYLLPRLRRMWTHLSRQVGGKGGATKGEGEKQIELDRRLVRTRITQLQKEIKEVAHHREQQRKQRLKQGIPSFAIVGYTNAGKSTLLNALTQAGILAEDKLFATLDTTTRRFMLPNQQQVLLIDTVGFIRKLPHTLVAAFKSTLEETLYTDILLHLVDVSHPEALEHIEATQAVLTELGAKERPTILVLNKIDACSNPALVSMFRVKYPNTIAISAKTHEGFDALMERMELLLASLRKAFHLRIPQSHFEIVSDLMRVGHIIDMDYEGNDVLLHVNVPSEFEHKVAHFVEHDL